MRIIEQFCDWVQPPPANTLQLIEQCGRTCYKSQDKITPDSAEGFVRRIIKSGHHSVIEHVSASVRFVTDRGVTHEKVRHRIASYSQESTRYCDYAKEFSGVPGDIQFIQPVDFVLTGDDLHLLRLIEQHYKMRRRAGLTPQQARYFLPNGLKTEIVMTANLREWRHFFMLRCSAAAHPQMRDLACKALAMFRSVVPVVFEDLP